MILFSSINCFAAESVDFSVEDCETPINRLFTVNVTAKSDIAISAATFEFTYDKSMFEYRSTKAYYDDSQIAANETDDKLKIVFLNTYGQNIKDGDIIFTITFKAVKSGYGYIDFSVYDCVDSNVEFMDVGKCTSSKVTVNDKSSSISEKSKNSNNKSDGKSSSKSSRNNEEDSTIDELGILNPLDDKSTRFLIIGIAIGAGIIGIIFVAYTVGKHSVQKKNDNDKNEIP